MKDPAELARELESCGKGAELEKLLRTPGAKRVEGMLDGRALEKAVGGGDTEALKRMLGAVLKTPDGRELAESVRKLMGG